jgi:hypothetical protein
MRSAGFLCGLALMGLPVPTASAQPPEKSVLNKITNADPAPRRGFNIVLLVGDMQGTGGQDGVPVAARKALADMKDFLPYKAYRLLDTQWIILGASGGTAVTRLRGVDDQEYELELRASPAMSPTALSVRFQLRDAAEGSAPSGDGSRTPLHPKELAKADQASNEIAREIFQLERERDDLQLLVAKGRRQTEVGIKDPEEVRRQEVQLAAVMKRIADLKQSLSAASSKSQGRTVIDTSFRMDDGETVVVGTSKVKGGKALIALLTATADRGKASTK